MTPRPHLHAVPRTLRRLGRDRSGAVAALVSLALPVLAGIGMLGVDAGVWYWERRTLQTAADAGAMAGAWHRYYRGTSGMTAAATAGATNNGAVGSVTVSNPPTTGAGAGDPTAVEVTIRQPLKLFYARAIGQEAATQSVAATASVVLDTNFCILGLDPTLSGAVTVQGTADITMTCGVAINSNSPSALSIAGGAQLTTTTASSVGGIDISGSPSITAPGGLRAQRPPVQDPYIDLEIPPWDPADCASVTVGGVTTIGPPPGSDTLVICSDIKVNSGDTLHLQEGTYILAGGQIQVMGGGTLTGDLAGTTLLLTDSPTNKGQVDIRGGAVVQLAAPTAGDWAGILVYQDRTAAAYQGANPIVNKFNGGADLDLQGAVYFPQQALDFSGGADIGPGCLQLVGRQVILSGNGDLNNNCGPAGARTIAVPALTLLR